MASLTKAINKDLFDKILPTFGNTRVHIPVWDEGQKMFLCKEYESGRGHRYYKGVRFCERIVFVENVGLYHNWTYIDSIEMYAFNGTKLELVQKRDYEKQFRNEEFIRKESQTMVQNYLEGILKVQKCTIQIEQLQEHARNIIDGCFKSFIPIFSCKIRFPFKRIICLIYSLLNSLLCSNFNIITSLVAFCIFYFLDCR